MRTTGNQSDQLSYHRAEQLNLAINPTFIPDLDLAFDLSAFNASSDESSSNSFVSSRAPLSSQSSLHLDQTEDTGVELPSYNTPQPISCGPDLYLGLGSISEIGVGATIGYGSLADDSPAIDDGYPFDVDEAGNIHPVDVGGDPLISLGENARSSPPEIHHDMVYDEQLQDPLILDADTPMMVDVDEQSNTQLFENLARQQNFPADTNQHETSGNSAFSSRLPEISPESVEMPQRRVRVAKVLQRDLHTELTNQAINEWNRNYLSNMAAAVRARQQNARADAKRYAAGWVLDQGLGRVASTFADDCIEHPFALFSGQALWDMLTGYYASPKGVKRTNHTVLDGEHAEEPGRRVRARNSAGPISRMVDQEGLETWNDGDILIQEDDVNIEEEVGRHAPPALQDLSSSMPWNTLQSSRQSSAQPHGSGLAGLGSSAGGLMGSLELGPPRSFGRGVRRLTSASPLHGKGGFSRLPSLDPRDLSRLTSNEDEFADLDRQLGWDNDADFELFGPSVAGDTQTTSQGQWIAATLETEAFNFFSFVTTKVQEQLDHADFRDEEGVGPDGEDGGGDTTQAEGATTTQRETRALKDSITFSQLLDPRHNSQVVGAQGLLHVLSLATKSMLAVYQGQAFGEIEIALAVARD